ncbi:hypothetical protein NA57DRAFT_73640 [Rhizodiscina lignyota]|uniref:Hepatocellular carcinoma-associated antigen 59-domain-containing protein n=1 Tax=Rhizodiscina lignyota TaxID=1504668 RepID=A0A9P4IJE0_9PEZI|nr:hypothetical protein NA57DRAFT_73640 [Rhizodiscina lignyota]
MAENGDNSEPMFKANKRRKIWRKRPISDEPEDVESESTQIDQALDASESGVSAQPPKAGMSIAEILRKRRQGQAHKAGIGFSNVKATKAGNSDGTTETARRNSEIAPPLENLNSRFVLQTGQRVADETDKHMNAYVEAKMAELRESGLSSQSDNQIRQAVEETLSAENLPRERKPTSSGKLMEVDLGPETTLRNIARTEAATKGTATGETEEYIGGGKRRRRRRNSEDVKRDKLVDEVLKQSRLDMYTPPEAMHDYGDEAADERIAEEFRKEFLNAIEDKNVRKPQPAAPAPGRGAKREDQVKGPKLGGSRNARMKQR